MYRTDTSLSHQQNRIIDYRKTSDSVSLFNVLTSDSLLDKVEELLPKHRERLYPPTETLSMFLSQAMSSDRSCQNSVNKSVIHRVGDGLSICSTKTGGYCRARKRLPEEMVSELTRYLGTMIDEQTIELWRWKKRRVRIVDGTTVTMPDTPSNQAIYPQQKGQREGVGFPICRVVGITCLSVELDIRHIKDTMGMGILSCKTPEMAIKKMWVYFLAYNLIRFLMMKSALLADICPRTISFKYCMQLWSSWSQQFTKMDQGKNQILFMLIAQQTVGNRPGRMEPRAVKRRAKPYPTLKQHRHLARAEVLKNGHP